MLKLKLWRFSLFQSHLTLILISEESCKACIREGATSYGEEKTSRSSSRQGYPAWGRPAPKLPHISSHRRKQPGLMPKVSPAPEFPYPGFAMFLRILWPWPVLELTWPGARPASGRGPPAPERTRSVGLAPGRGTQHQGGLVQHFYTTPATGGSNQVWSLRFIQPLNFPPQVFQCSWE